MDLSTTVLPQESVPTPIGNDHFAALVERFLQCHDVSPISRENYRRRLKHFFLWLQEIKPASVERNTIIQYKRHLQERNFTPISEGAYLVAVRCFFAWAEAEKLHPNVAKSVRGAKKQRGFRKDPLTVAQIQKLLSSIDRSTVRGKRDYALLNLMIRTGERTIEISRANIEDIRQESGQIVLWLQGKGHAAKDQFVVLTESAHQPILDYLAERKGAKPAEPLFGSTSDSNRHQRLTTRSIRRIVKQRLRSIQLDTPRLSAHSLRHTTVTLALLAGASVQETQQLARHQDPATTMIYAHNISRAEGVPERKIDEILSPVELGIT